MTIRFHGFAVAILAVSACAEDGRDVAGAPDAAPGDPAVYAPEGWPLKVGDEISARRREELTAFGRWREGSSRAEFPGLGAVEAIHEVNGRTYGARFGYGVGFLSDEDFSNVTIARERRLGLPGRHYIYEGHFPAKVADTHWRHEHLLPEHLRGRIEYYEEVRSFERADHQHEWEEERARMRASGLLPTPDQMSPGLRK